MTTSSNALTQVDVTDCGCQMDVSHGCGSVTVIMTVVICPMNRTAVSNVNLAYISVCFINF